MTSAKGVGMPIKLLHESEGHIITVRARDLDIHCLRALQRGRACTVLRGLCARSALSTFSKSPNP